MKNKRNLFWGLFFVLAGVLVIAAQFGSFGQIGLWSILATVVLVAIMVKSIVDMEFIGILLPVAFLYSIYQGVLGLPKISIWVLLLAAVLAGCGLSMLFRKRPKAYYAPYVQAGGPPTGEQAELEVGQNTDDNHPYAKVRFGAISKYLHSNCLENGQFYASFGALEVYFDQAVLSPAGADIFVDSSFGAIKLYIPRGWQVKDNVATTFGAVENKTQNISEVSGPELRLTGNVSFGAIEIQYI